MKSLVVLATALVLAAGASRAQDLIDKGMVHGWNLMVDPAFGNGCLIQTVYQDLSVVRLGFDATEKRGYFAVFNRNWGEIEPGQTYNIRFALDGQNFDAFATGFRHEKIPAAVVFFTDPGFVHAIAQHRDMTVYGQTGQEVMAIDLAGTSKALEYARKCQDEMGW